MPAFAFCRPSFPRALPSLATINGLRISTLQHVPKGARDDWARVVGEALQGILSDLASIDAWCKWFMLARCVLANSARGGRSHWVETLKIVRVRMRRWRAGDFLGLWSELVNEQDRLSHQRKLKKMSAESLRATNARRARRAVEDGQYKKATQTLTSDGLAQASPEVFAEMLMKHPQGDLPLIPQDQVPAPIKINLRSFPNGTAPGPSALHANHLKEAVFCPSPDRAYTTLQVLSRVINLLCSGQVPSDVVPHLCGAILFACEKKGGGLRPIAVGEVLCRLTSKCISRTVQGEAFKALTPLQVGWVSLWAVKLLYCC